MTRRRTSVIQPGPAPKQPTQALADPEVQAWAVSALREIVLSPEGDEAVEQRNLAETRRLWHIVAQGKRGGAAWGAFALVKIIVLFGGIWVLLTRGWVDPMPLVVGYGVLPLGITASGLFGSLAPRPRRSAKTAARTR